MTGGDRSLQSVRAQRAPERLGTLERCETATDEELIPSRAVLLEERDGLSRRADPCTRPGGLDLHQGDQSVRLRFLWNQLCEDATETQRLFAERWPHPMLTSGRRIALVEDEINHF